MFYDYKTLIYKLILRILIMKKSKNWNAYTGERIYKCNCWLKFLDDFTLSRYIYDKFRRLRFHIKSYLVAMALSFIYFIGFHTSEINYCWFILGTTSLAMSWNMLITKKDRLKGKGILLLSELSLQIELAAINNASFGTQLLISNIVLLISNLLLIYIWYHHLIISFALILIRHLLILDYSFDIICSEIFVTCITTTMFGYIERISKEDWVLYDSFKRSNNLHIQLISQQEIPNFVVDETGKILHENVSGLMLYEKKPGVHDHARCHSSGNECVFKIIHPDYKKTILKLLKETNKQNIEPIDVPLLSKHPGKNNYKEDLSSFTSLITQGII